MNLPYGDEPNGRGEAVQIRSGAMERIDRGGPCRLSTSFASGASTTAHDTPGSVVTMIGNGARTLSPDGTTTGTNPAHGWLPVCTTACVESDASSVGSGEGADGW
jgi:hypothetical protein